MRLHDGNYECSHCGAILEIPPYAAPHVTIRAASGKPNVRTLMFEGHAIHSCEMPAPRRTREELRQQAAELRIDSAELRAHASEIVARSDEARR